MVPGLSLSLSRFIYPKLFTCQVSIFLHLFPLVSLLLCGLSNFIVPSEVLESVLPCVNSGNYSFTGGSWTQERGVVNSQRMDTEGNEVMLTPMSRFLGPNTTGKTSRRTPSHPMCSIPT